MKKITRSAAPRKVQTIFDYVHGEKGELFDITDCQGRVVLKHMLSYD